MTKHNKPNKPQHPVQIDDVIALAQAIYQDSDLHQAIKEMATYEDLDMAKFEGLTRTFAREHQWTYNNPLLVLTLALQITWTAVKRGLDLQSERARHHVSEMGQPYEPTSVEDLCALARALLDDPYLGSALQRVGIHGDLTESEEDELAKFIDKFGEKEGWGYREQKVLTLSVVLARQVAAGEMESVTDPAAREFIEDRKFDSTTDNGGILTKTPTAAEVMLIARALRANPTAWNAIENWAKTGQLIPEEYWKSTLRVIERKIVMKYGLLNRGPLDSYSMLFTVANGKFKDLDDPAAWEFLRRNKTFVKE